MDPQRLKPDSFVIARSVFARFLGAIFLFAFGSIAWQVRGLLGERGISPAAEFLPAARRALGGAAFWQVPTLFWIDASDVFLIGVCWAGAAISVVLMCGVFPAACALALWLLYLSLCSVGSPFLEFQWDALLLETAFLAIFFLPFRRRLDWRKLTPLANGALLLLWWLLFRLLFESGAVKLASGDETWRHLTALDFHFETQPLPLWPSWFAHQLPSAARAFCTFAVLAIEFIAPCLIVAPRRIRHAAAWAMIALQIGILITGNYAFFNLLTIALCLLLFEDAAWPRGLRARVPESEPRPEEMGRSRSSARQFIGEIVRLRNWPLAFFALVAAAIVVVTAMPLVGTLGLVRSWPGPLRALRTAVEPLRSFNGYGLFAVMTTSRPEIVIEGSDDGRTWREYEFPWKAGDLRQRPRLAAPHQPRLDWQMWFAALGSYRENAWLLRFVARLLAGSPDVLALLHRNPFPDHPPAMIRARLYEYHFTHFGEGAAWWKRDAKGLYLPALSLRENGDLAPVETLTPQL